jgi:putative heme iron utilization protein
MHAWWVAYIQWFTFSLKNNSGKLNCVADTMSRWGTVMVTVKGEVIVFECLKDLNEEDEYFSDVWRRCNMSQPVLEMHTHEGYVF